MEEENPRNSLMVNVIQAGVYSSVVKGFAGNRAADYRMKMVHRELRAAAEESITEEQKKKKWYNSLHLAVFYNSNDDPDTRIASYDRRKKGCQSSTKQEWPCLLWPKGN